MIGHIGGGEKKDTVPRTYMKSKSLHACDVLHLQIPMLVSSSFRSFPAHPHACSLASDPRAFAELLNVALGLVVLTPGMRSPREELA